MITKHSEYHGDEYDGNSLLLELKDDNVYVGSRVYMFTSNSEIIEYKSLIGNCTYSLSVCIISVATIFLLSTL
jgi:hypothetical protein